MTPKPPTAPPVLPDRRKRIAKPHRPVPPTARTASLGSWIVETPGAGGGGGTPPPDNPPPVVTIQSVTVLDHYDGTAQVSVAWTKNPAATTTNFKGIELFLEDPDNSSAPPATLDNTVPLNATAGLQGDWTTKTLSKYTSSPAVFSIDLGTAARQARVYAPAYNATHPAVPVRATDPSPSPNMAFTVPAAQYKYVAGMEFTWLCKNPQVTVVPNFENPAGPQYGLDFTYDPPDMTKPLPPGMAAFAGVHIKYLYIDGRTADGPDLFLNAPQDWHVSGYPVGGSDEIGVYFLSIDVDGRVNSPVDLLTPYVTYSVSLDAIPDASNFVLSNARDLPFVDGSIMAYVDATWTNPSSNRVVKQQIYRVDPTSPKLYGEFPVGITKGTLQENNWPSSTQNWTMVLISVDRDGNLADDPKAPTHSPTQTWQIGPPQVGGAGVEYGTNPGIVGTTVTAEQQVGGDGIMMMRFHIGPWQNPAWNGFGGVSIARTLDGSTNNPVWWNAAPTDTSMVTPWEPATSATTFDFWLVSRNLQNQRNTLQVGFTPVITFAFTPTPGKLLTSRMPTDWFNTTEFAWPTPDTGGLFTASQIASKKIFVGSILRVGGGTTGDTGTPGQPGFIAGTNPSFGAAQNGQIAVYNSVNKLVAWAGQQDGTTAPSDPAGTTPYSIWGGWFGELYVGGAGPPTAPLYCNNAGLVILGGFDVKNVAGTNWAPYMSVRDEYNVEKGRIGAHLGYGLPATDPYGQPVPQIAGAWFYEFAVGGQSMTDWRFLSQRSTNPSNLQETNIIRIRNVNDFFIEYPQGSSTAAYRMIFGLDAWQTSSMGGRYFAGIQIDRLSATNGAGSGNEVGHLSVLVNRGLILKGRNTSGVSATRAYMVTYNNDPNGNDADPWFGDFATYDQAGNRNVRITGDTGQRAFQILDTSGNQVVAGETNGYLGAQTEIYAGPIGNAWGSVRVYPAGAANQAELFLRDPTALYWTCLAYGGFFGSGITLKKEGSGINAVSLVSNTASAGQLTLYDVTGSNWCKLDASNGSAFFTGKCEADGGFNCGGVDGYYGTFVLNDGRTVSVVGGIITHIG